MPTPTHHQAPVIRSLTLRRSLLVAAPTALLLVLAPAAPAFAGEAERRAACTALGGDFRAGEVRRGPIPPQTDAS